MKLADIAIFNKVAATLSFTRAGNQLGLSRSAVSKRISNLERDTGVRLLQRSARSVKLTSAGERFYDHTAQLDETLSRAREALRDTIDSPCGKLSFTMPTSLGASFMPLLMRQFQPAWPEIDMHIDLNEAHMDIIAEGFDLAIRVAKKLPDSSLMSKRLATSAEILVASPGYIALYGEPRRLEELRVYRCLAQAKSDSTWRMTGPNGPIAVRPERVTSFNNDLAMILAAVLDGGILRTPLVFVASEILRGRLQPILTQYKSKRDYGVFALYPNRNTPASVRVLIEFFEEWLPRISELDRWDPLQLACPKERN